jgi:hypothetical protein
MPVSHFRSRSLDIRYFVDTTTKCFGIPVFAGSASKHHPAGAALKPVNETQVPNMTIGDWL